jgi:hypothetical protein
MMLRILRAFVWLRWRVLVNSLERTGSRDMIERFSIATEKLGPILALVLLIPTALGLTVVGLVGGHELTRGGWSGPFEIIRYFLLVGTVLTIFGPIVLPTRGGENAVRFLLLPISRRLLYTAHVAAALADPWILLVVPVVISVPLGLAIGGALGTAALALLAGLALLVLVSGLTSLTSSVIELLLRNRRRSEFVMLVLILVLPLIGFVPQLIVRQDRHQRARERVVHQVPADGSPTRAQRLAADAFAYVPSELYRRTAITARTSPLDGTGPLAGLLVFASAIQALSFAAYRRMLDMPVTQGARRAGAFGGLWGRTIPGLSPGASAVAFTQLRLAMRTPRGRSILAAPLLMIVLFGFMLMRPGGGGRVPVLASASGLGLAIFGCFISLAAIVPLAANQFAIDKAGFTRQMLSPLSIGELLAGKAIGNAMIAAVPGFCCFILPAIVLPSGSPGLWAALFFAVVAAYALTAPVSAALSAVFPRRVDLSSIGNASNAHQAAGLLGMLAILLAGVPSALLAFLALAILERPELVPVFVFGWCVVAVLTGRLLFVPVKRLVARRCETLAKYD